MPKRAPSRQLNSTFTHPPPHMRPPMPSTLPAPAPVTVPAPLRPSTSAAYSVSPSLSAASRQLYRLEDSLTPEWSFASARRQLSQRRVDTERQAHASTDKQPLQLEKFRMETRMTAKQWAVHSAVHQTLQDRQKLGLPDLDIENVENKAQPLKIYAGFADLNTIRQ
ncbi:hypothetical protein MMC22_005071 [Lobaria immixta]|nr:hypothetical protein [Lobaria immixta]